VFFVLFFKTTNDTSQTFCALKAYASFVSIDTSHKLHKPQGKYLALTSTKQGRSVERVEFKAALVSRKLAAEQRFTGVSKRQAKRDKLSLHKAKAWHCEPLHINTILRATKQSRITWI